MEYYEVYDKEGNPTGVVESRETVHQKGLWHATVHVWIYTEGGEILLQKRSRNKDSHPFLWDISAAGHLTPGENPADAAIREMMEELSIKARARDLVFLDRRNLSLVSKGGSFIDNEITSIYLYKWEGSLCSLKPDGEEVEALSFFSIRDLSKLLDDPAGRTGFVPHGEEYHGWILGEIEKRTERTL